MSFADIDPPPTPNGLRRQRPASSRSSDIRYSTHQVDCHLEHRGHESQRSITNAGLVIHFISALLSTRSQPHHAQSKRRLPVHPRRQSIWLSRTTCTSLCLLYERSISRKLIAIARPAATSNTAPKDVRSTPYSTLSFEITRIITRYRQNGERVRNLSFCGSCGQAPYIFQIHMSIK